MRTFTPAERATLTGGMVAAALVPLNSTMIAVALPNLARDLGVGRGTAASLVVAYLVAMALCQPFAGRLGDRLGSRRVALTSLVGFAAMSGVAAASPSFLALLGARVVQALFGAALVPNVQALVRSAVVVERRGRAFGVLGVGIGTGAALGPVLGGVLVDLTGWRSIFLLSAPVAIAALVLVRRVGADVRPHEPEVVHDAALRRRPFVAACVAQGASNLSLYTVLLVVPVLLDDRGWSSSATGVVLMGLTLGMVVLNPVGGSIGDRRGHVRPVFAGMLLIVAGASLLTVVAGDTPVLLVAAVVVIGLGMGLGNASLQTAALEAVPDRAVGAAAGVLSTSRYVGSITGSVALGFLVGDSGDGARSVLAITTVAAVVALAASTRIVDARVTEPPSTSAT